MKKFLFVDLDDTLFQTRKKCPDGADLRPVAFLTDGTAISFSTAKQRALLDWLGADTTLIPATARNLDAFGRVDLPFSSHAILNYGGIILGPERQPDPVWLGTMQHHMTSALPALQQARELIDQYLAQHGMRHRARLIEDFGLPFYLVLKDPDGDSQKLAQVETDVLRPWLAASHADCHIHRNGNNLALLPRALNKAHAVRYLQQHLRDRFGEILSIGLADSHSDAAFLAACDYGMIPAGTQLAQLLDAA